jgi:hypothetical protein
MVSSRDYEIQEASGSEIEPAFSSRDNTITNFDGRGHHINSAIKYGDHFYRPIRSVAKAIDACFRHPYHARSDCDQGVYSHFYNKVDFAKHVGTVSKRTWPFKYRMDDLRDETVLEEWLDKIDEIDPSALKEIDQSFNAVAKGLLIYDNHLWYRVPEPRIKVQLEWQPNKDRNKVMIMPWFVDDYPTGHYDVSRRLFALNDMASAEEYATSLVSPDLPRDEDPKIFRSSGIYALGDVTPYDGGSEHLRCISRELAYAICGSDVAHQPSGRAWNADQENLIQSAKHGLLRENYVLNNGFDMSTHVGELFELWKTMGMPYAKDVFGMNADLTNELITQLIDELEPISPDFWVQSPRLGTPKT